MINEQNIKADYLALLGDMYEPFNLSKDKILVNYEKCKKIIVDVIRVSIKFMI